MKIVSYIHLHAQKSSLCKLLDFMLFNISYTRIRIRILIENITNKSEFVQSKNEVCLPETFFRYVNELDEKIIIKGIRIKNKNFVRVLLNNTNLNTVYHSDLYSAKFLISDVVTSIWGGRFNACYPNNIEPGKLFNIANIFLDIPYDELYESAVQIIAKSYRVIAIFVTNALSRRVLDFLSSMHCNVVLVYPKDIIEYNQKKNALNIELGCVPDVFISFSLGMAFTKIWINNIHVFHLPFHNMFCGDNSRYYGYEFEMDIIKNVIPQFTDNGIKTVIIGDLLRKQEKCQFEHASALEISVKDEDAIEEINNFLGSNHLDIKDALAAGQGVMRNHVFTHNDYNSKAINFNFGDRYTTGNTYQEKNMIHFFGPCISWGVYAVDERTIESYLRQELGIASDFGVQNHVCGSWEWIVWSMRNQLYLPGDIVIIFAFSDELYCENDIQVIDIAPAFYQLGEDLSHCVWEHFYHCNWKVNREIALWLSGYLHENRYLEGFEGEINPYSLLMRKESIEHILSPSQENKLLQWSAQYRNCDIDGIIGAICMNCNPMTNGHLYLIEYASSKVDYLYVFILEEDKSDFKFADRIALVKDAVKYIDNVFVVPSGEFIISSGTMPGYFTKNTLSNTCLDASYDLSLFINYVCPAFGISVRFAGEEPLDRFTSQYNRNMRITLPFYGIDFIEIPRKTFADKVISASRVRKLLEGKKWEEIKPLVPQNVYDFLRLNYMTEQDSK